MPVLNGSMFLREAVESLLAQTRGDFELLISDNASDDDTMAIAEQFQREDERVRPVRLRTRQPAAEHFNTVLRRATAPLFMWAAHDDVWEPSFVGETSRILLSNGDVAVAFCGFDNVDPSGRTTRSYPSLQPLTERRLVDRLTTFISYPEHLGKANVIYGMMRREALTSAGGMRSWGAGQWGIDMLTVFRCLFDGRLELADGVLFHKRDALHEDRPPRLLDVLRSNLPSWHGYLIGYSRIARQAHLPRRDTWRIHTAIGRHLAWGDVRRLAIGARTSLGKAP